MTPQASAGSIGKDKGVKGSGGAAKLTEAAGASKTTPGNIWEA